jgi:pyruvate formate lyase activating enzyme
MVIGGFQKFTLADFPGKIAAIVFTRGCGLRCPYCHNPELVDPARYARPIPPREIMDFLARRRGRLSGVVVTGGEPTLHADLPSFLADVRQLGLATKLDTNGTNPDMLADIIGRGLVDYVAMDVKAPFGAYERVTRTAVRDEDIRRSIELIVGSGVANEFRTTWCPSLLSIRELAEIGAAVKGCGLFVLQGFRPTAVLDEGFRGQPVPDEPAMTEARAVLAATGLTVLVR